MIAHVGLRHVLRVLTETSDTVILKGGTAHCGMLYHLNESFYAVELIIALTIGRHCSGSRQALGHKEKAHPSSGPP